MHRSRKPVRKCHGCGLNFGDYCGVYEDPHAMWQRHAVCQGHGNEKMLAEYEAELVKRQAHASKDKRKEVAKIRQTATHKNGDRHVVITAVRG